MSLIERTATALLGARVDAPSDLPPQSLPPGVTLRRGALIPWLGGLFARARHPASAVTLRNTIILGPAVRLTPQLLAHELVHVRQWREDPLFPIRYSLATLRHGYFDNPYEVEARQVASRYSSSMNG